MLLGLLFLLVCIITYFGVAKVYGGETVGPISLLFLILWLAAVIGLFIGQVIWALFQNLTVTFDLDFIINSLFINLPISLGPAFAAALSISNGSAK